MLKVKTTKPNRTAGVTLIEVTITLALIAIVSSMVVSFSALTIINTREYQTYDKLRREEATIESAVSSWIGYFDSSDYSLTVTDGGATLKADNGNDQTNYTFGFKNGTVYSNYGNEDVKNRAYKLTQITGLHVTQSTDKDGVLVKFEFSYTVNDESGVFTVYKAKRSLERGLV